jgi:UDP-N-acetylmuramoyl-L-alanyl-D-glutamate--2,6-diaminopimelate ligase
VPGYPRPNITGAVAVSDLATVARGRLAGTQGDELVTGVTHASGEVHAGDLYAGLPGAVRHGAEFATQARERGAVALLTDERGQQLAGNMPAIVASDPRAVLGAVASAVYGSPTARMPVIGITGTAGKTSTAYLVESGLRAAGHVPALIGTVETRLGDLVVDSTRTTPEATDLHALFAAGLERGVTAAVMEVSSHALHYGRVGGVHFEAGGWTNFGLDHLDFHADVDDYFAAKAKLFDGRCRYEVLNLDDPALRPLLRPGRLTFSAAGDEAATWRAADVASDGFGELASRTTKRGAQMFVAIRGDEHLPMRVALPGRHNVANALLALALLTAIGIDPATAAKGIGECTGVPGRLELIDAPGPVTGVVDYAHKPDAIVAALAALRELGSGRLICLIGAGGDRDRGKRPLMGAAAARGADVVIVTDDNPRSEDPAAIRAEVLKGARGAMAEVVEVAGRREAIAEAVRRARPGDVVALLGKGHETGQETLGVVTPFDDRVELSKALRGVTP